MYPRLVIDSIKQWLTSREVLIIYGARQVGKTTLLKSIMEVEEKTHLLNCELPVISDILENRELSSIKALFGENRIIGLDEAQTIVNIGSVLKLIYDELPEYKIIATGSGSFDLANRIVEPLTGRNIKFRMYPLSLSETVKKHDWLWNLSHFKEMLIYGTYPGIINLPVEKKETKLTELSSDYLYKDILVHEQISNPAIIRKLLKALALQVGSQVSVNELSNLLGVTRQTIDRYLDLLEKSFVIFPLESYSSNLRNEIKKSRKYYFFDNGIMNALTSNFTPIDNRADIGALWENFCVAERIRVNTYNNRKVNFYFWRTYDGAEIDLIEESRGALTPFEFKWKQDRISRIPVSFMEKYQPDRLHVITPSNLHELIKVDY